MGDLQRARQSGGSWLDKVVRGAGSGSRKMAGVWGRTKAGDGPNRYPRRGLPAHGCPCPLR